ncbi:prepilin-type N-terminal cleavage/methylation domain-containing protein [Paraglaciecola arctica]|uniref:Protein containing prepilin-type cleavage/methylation, N-terminal domains n=1 Tax=Paraglaciecola arctica BSs20135 TaxID=493475 RepID=K6YAU9_9ALTE|nr:prepilin-type N-terminal cleavage/methylation domain-containing protein [Paraglaciecola arctica]GAC21091.1 protein containing prepilin-type cleavage/methylation, N-terminal domains [Paraglaciecola arctica BSs20135]
MSKNKNKGFTLIELIIVIVILGILAVVAAPKFIDISSDAKIAVLNSLSGQFKSTITLVQMKARVKGLKTAATNPNGIQTDYIVDFGFGSVEIDWRNLCPESQGEGGDKLDMLDFLDISDDFETRVDNQYTLIGYQIPSSGTPTTEGCYLIYDSFGFPNCTVEIVTVDC